MEQGISQQVLVSATFFRAHFDEKQGNLRKFPANFPANSEGTAGRASNTRANPSGN
jgi:hypothetical protein